MIKTIKPKTSLKATIKIPGDKSISHRAIMLGAISSGITEITGFLMGEDCLSTISCFRKLGIEIEVNNEKVIVYGKGMKGLSAPEELLDVGNSGTTLRLITGLLSAQPFTSFLSGDASIRKRPMDRVAKPLALMGAQITGNGSEKLLAPLQIIGNNLKGIHYTLPVASAQVKSAVLLAGLYAEGDTVVTEPEATRDHTEIMLNELGAKIERKGKDIICHTVDELYGTNISVPGDISSAAYFLVAGLISKNSEITVKNVGVNPTRTGIITALEAMGAELVKSDYKLLNGEPVCDITVHTTPLKATTIEGELIPLLIDEIPILAVAACFASGQTVIKDAQELKVKESNRIKSVVTELKKMGADIEETTDGMIINGGNTLYGTNTQSYQDHRIAMSIAVTGLLAEGETTIQDAQCVDISFPNFFDILSNL